MQASAHFAKKATILDRANASSATRTALSALMTMDAWSAHLGTACMGGIAFNVLKTAILAMLLGCALSAAMGLLRTPIRIAIKASHVLRVARVVPLPQSAMSVKMRHPSWSRTGKSLLALGSRRERRARS